MGNTDTPVGDILFNESSPHQKGEGHVLDEKAGTIYRSCFIYQLQEPHLLPLSHHQMIWLLPTSRLPLLHQFFHRWLMRLMFERRIAVQILQKKTTVSVHLRFVYLLGFFITKCRNCWGPARSVLKYLEEFGLGLVIPPPQLNRVGFSILNHADLSAIQTCQCKRQCLDIHILLFM